ncbi:MAG: YlmH/Sll1252 family protein [Clostridium sp.]
MLTIDDKNINRLMNRFSVEKDRAVMLYGKLRLSKKTWDVFYTDFLTLAEQEFIKYLAYEESMEVDFLFEEGFERNMAGVSPYETTLEYPCRVLQIIANTKFEKVGHRDYLGSILALGIKREKIGDIIVSDSGAIVLAHEDVSSYIEINLTKVKNSGVRIKEISLENLDVKSVVLKEESVNVTSLRLDAVIASMYNISRSKAQTLIKGGEVKINSVIAIDVSKVLSENDVITVRGFGKSKVGQIVATTKKERLILTIFKYT